MSPGPYRHVYYTPRTFATQVSASPWRAGRLPAATGQSANLSMCFVRSGDLTLSLALMPLSLQYALRQAVIAAEGRLGLGSVS